MVPVSFCVVFGVDLPDYISLQLENPFGKKNQNHAKDKEDDRSDNIVVHNQLFNS